MQCCLRVEWQKLGLLLKVQGHGDQGLGLLRDEELGRPLGEQSKPTECRLGDGKLRWTVGEQKVVSAR